MVLAKNVGKGVVDVSGPALRQRDSHHAIHQSAWLEANDVLERAATLLRTTDVDRLVRVVEVFLEVIEMRILSHAHEEELDLYAEWIKQEERYRLPVASLVHEHDMLRQLASGIEVSMIKGNHDGALTQMREFLRVSADHANHEEELLGAVQLNQWEGSS